jgi:hypothetical protein
MNGMKGLRFLSKAWSAPSSIGSTFGADVAARPAVEMSSGPIGSLPDDAVRALESSAGMGSLSSPLIVTGKSGVRHGFTLGIKGPVSIALACDVMVSEPPTPIDETKVLSLFIKVYDVNANNVVLCAIPSLTAEAKKLASQYKMIVLEAPDMEQAFAKLPDVLRKLPIEK